MIKKIISFALALTMLLSILATVSACNSFDKIDDEEDEDEYIEVHCKDKNDDLICDNCGLKFKVNGDSATIVGIGECTDSTVKIPDYFNGKKVSALGFYAFQNAKNIEVLKIPKNFSFIGDNALSGCDNIKSINVASENETYKSIDGNLYSKDRKKLIKYAPGKTKTSFDIPKGVKNIDSAAFAGADSLESVSIPSSVTNIESIAFARCTNLESIIFYGTMEQWEAVTKASNWDSGIENCTVYYVCEE